MSKSDQMYMDLERQAHDLGFQDVGDACGHGYDIVGTELKPTAWLLQAQAREEWLKEKEEVIAALKRAIKLIEGGEV